MQHDFKHWIEGPLGFPMPDAAARSLEAVLRTLPRNDSHSYRHLVMIRAPTELNPGERSDVSWISTEVPDRAGDVVIASGMDDREFRLNPLVTLAHDYNRPPVGRGVWRRRVRDGQLVGIKAKTHYPPRPEGLEGPWPPDEVFAHIQAGLLVGKSIGFLPLETHIPDEAEARRRGWPDSVRLVIDRWLLLEYACVSIPANPLALVESVTKMAVGYTTFDEIAQAIERRVRAADIAGLVRRAVTTALERLRGRV